MEGGWRWRGTNSKAFRKLCVANCRNSIQKVRRRTYLAKGLKLPDDIHLNAFGEECIWRVAYYNARTFSLSAASKIIINRKLRTVGL